jgi:predicted PurR-regulated permease PerM
MKLGKAIGVAILAIIFIWIGLNVVGAVLGFVASILVPVTIAALAAYIIYRIVRKNDRALPGGYDPLP